jgi:hypothetical protein
MGWWMERRWERRVVREVKEGVREREGRKWNAWWCRPMYQRVRREEGEEGETTKKKVSGGSMMVDELVLKDGVMWGSNASSTAWGAVSGVKSRSGEVTWTKRTETVVE